MRHTITVTIDSDSDREAVVSDISDTLIDVSQGYIGDPDQHAIHGGQLVSVE